MIPIRLWHKDLIPVLPRRQLLSQWRECCCIAKNIAEKGTPNHVLVNKILDYPIEHFYTYGMAVTAEMVRRGYRPSMESMMVFTNNILKYDALGARFVPADEVFSAWHTDRYLDQCYFNLQEKYDCGGIPFEEWKKLEAAYLKMHTCDPEE